MNILAGLVLIVAWPPVAASHFVILPDPLEVTAFAVYDRDGGCQKFPNCLDGDHAREYRDRWMKLHMEWIDGVPEDAVALAVQARMNITHPAADASVCYMQIMATTEPEAVDARTDRQWLLRLMSHRDSERDSQHTLIPVADGVTWVRYTYRLYDEARHWPETCSYGFHISVQGYWR